MANSFNMDPLNDLVIYENGQDYCGKVHRATVFNFDVHEISLTRIGYSNDDIYNEVEHNILKNWLNTERGKWIRDNCIKIQIKTYNDPVKYITKVCLVAHMTDPQYVAYCMTV